MSCPCQKEVKDLQNILKKDGTTLPEPTLGIKVLSVVSNILFYILCISIGLLLFPFLFLYILLAGIFNLNTSISTSKIVKFIKFFG